MCQALFMCRSLQGFPTKHTAILRHREALLLVQPHTARKRRSWNLNPGWPDSQACGLPTDLMRVRKGQKITRLFGLRQVTSSL